MRACHDGLRTMPVLRHRALHACGAALFVSAVVISLACGGTASGRAACAASADCAADEYCGHRVADGCDAAGYCYKKSECGPDAGITFLCFCGFGGSTTPNCEAT